MNRSQAVEPTRGSFVTMPSVERIEIQPEDSLIAQAFVLRRFSYLRIGPKPGYVRDIKPSEVLQFRGRDLVQE